MGFLTEFYEKYLTLNLYEYVGVDLPINLVILAVALALCAACFYVGHKQNTEALILRKLIRSASFGEACAKTVSELGLNANRYAMRILSLESGSIRTVVARLGERKLSYEEYIAAEREMKKLSRKERREREMNELNEEKPEPSFYIHEDMKNEAKRLFERNTSSPLKTALYCIIILAFAIAVIMLMPMILELIRTAESA